MILVTGATGTSGTRIVEALIASGATVRAMTRDPGRAAALAALGAQVVPGHFDQPDTLAAALKGCERALLLTAVDHNMLKREKMFIEAARNASRHGLKHLVKFSALGADAAAKAFFLRTHGASENAIERTGVAWTHLRPNFFMQNFLGQAGSIKAEHRCYGSQRDGRASQVDVRDIAAVAARVLTDPIDRHAGAAHVITGPEALSGPERAAVLSRVLGHTIEYADVPPDSMRQSLVQAGAPAWLAAAVVELDALVHDGRAATVTDSVLTVGQKPPITFEQFARDHAAAFA